MTSGIFGTTSFPTARHHSDLFLCGTWKKCLSGFFKESLLQLGTKQYLAYFRGTLTSSDQTALSILKQEIRNISNFIPILYTNVNINRSHSQ